MPHKTYSEMQAQWQANWNFAEVFSGDLEFKTLQADADDDVYAQMPVDTTSSNEKGMKWYLIQHNETGASKGVIIMWCHNGAEDKNNYYIWGRTLAERTGKAILIPDRNGIFNNEALKPCLDSLCESIRNGRYPGIDRNVQTDYFTSGNAIEEVMNLMTEDSGKCFSQSKLIILGRAPEGNVSIPEVLKDRMFVISQDRFPERKSFLSKRSNPVEGYSSLSLNADFEFSGKNIFPVEKSDSRRIVDKQYEKVFTMASWFLNGIN
jgi:hypothetical protein